jgi:oligopeptide/dipeptide ABC transporter ATP-binding protein
VTGPEPLLSVTGLYKHFPVTRGVFGRAAGRVHAVDGVAFEVYRGETLALVGESGSGKTTVGRCALRLLEPTRGQIVFCGKDLTSLSDRELRGVRRDLQVVFQDPMSSLNPRMRVFDILGEPLRVHGIVKSDGVERRVGELLEKVGLSPSAATRYPHEFSGGQRQRIGIARALALEPKLIVCDEAVSALDVSVQAQVVNLLLALQKEFGLSYLFIAHDLGVVRHISHRVAVMYLGERVEVAPTRLLFDAPAHPYTRTLLSAIPTRDPRRRGGRLVLTGDVPSPMNPPSGCRFHTRCPAAFDRCRSEWPEAVEVEPGHTVRCFHVHDLDASRPWLPQVSERIEVACAANRFPKSADEPSVRRKPATTNSPKPRDRATRPVAKASSAPHVWLAATAVGLVLVALGHAISGAAIVDAERWMIAVHRNVDPEIRVEEQWRGEKTLSILVLGGRGRNTFGLLLRKNGIEALRKRRVVEPQRIVVATGLQHVDGIAKKRGFTRNQ